MVQGLNPGPCACVPAPGGTSPVPQLFSPKQYLLLAKHLLHARHSAKGLFPCNPYIDQDQLRGAHDMPLPLGSPPNGSLHLVYKVHLSSGRHGAFPQAKSCGGHYLDFRMQLHILHGPCWPQRASVGGKVSLRAGRALL